MRLLIWFLMVVLWYELVFFFLSFFRFSLVPVVG